MIGFIISSILRKDESFKTISHIFPTTWTFYDISWKRYWLGQSISFVYPAPSLHQSLSLFILRNETNQSMGWYFPDKKRLIQMSCSTGLLQMIWGCGPPRGLFRTKRDLSQTRKRRVLYTWQAFKLHSHHLCGGFSAEVSFEFFSAQPLSSVLWFRIFD